MNVGCISSIVCRYDVVGDYVTNNKIDIKLTKLPNYLMGIIKKTITITKRIQNVLPEKKKKDKRVKWGK